MSNALNNVIELTARRRQLTEPEATTDEGRAKQLCQRIMRMSSVKTAHACAEQGIANPAVSELCKEILEARSLIVIKEVAEDYLNQIKGVGTIQYCEFVRGGTRQYAFRLVQPGLFPTCEVQNEDFDKGVAELQSLGQKSRMMIDWEKVDTKQVAPWGNHGIRSRADVAAELRKQQRDNPGRWSLLNRTQPSC